MQSEPKSCHKMVPMKAYLIAVIINSAISTHRLFLQYQERSLFLIILWKIANTLLCCPLEKSLTSNPDSL